MKSAMMLIAFAIASAAATSAFAAPPVKAVKSTKGEVLAAKTA